MCCLLYLLQSITLFPFSWNIVSTFLKEMNRSFIYVTDVAPHDHTGTTAYTAATSCSRRVRVGRSCYISCLPALCFLSVLDVCQYPPNWDGQDCPPALIAAPCSGRTAPGQCWCRRSIRQHQRLMWTCVILRTRTQRLRQLTDMKHPLSGRNRVTSRLKSRSGFAASTEPIDTAWRRGKSDLTLSTPACTRTFVRMNTSLLGAYGRPQPNSWN